MNNCWEENWTFLKG